MTTLIHPVIPEDIMALIDGELTAAEAALISQHIEQCSECAALRAQLRDTSECLANWTVPAASATLERAVEDRLAETAHSKRTPGIKTRFTFRNWRVWAVGGAGATVGVLALIVFIPIRPSYKLREPAEQHAVVTNDALESPSSQASQPQAVAGIAAMSEYADAVPADKKAEVVNGQLQATTVVNGQPQAVTNAPLIARTASLTVLIKNLDVARGDLDAILTRHHGYAAQLTVQQQASPRNLTGSLRIPVGELQAAIAELRAIGIVERESQSGEEVTQQHTDLTARLANARETEARLRDILAHRTGKMQDILDVEENISATRGEIEQLEAEQTNLEHRVEFASVDVELTEQYKAQLGSPSTSIPNQMRNSFVAGLGYAGDSLLGLVLFIEEYSPVLLVWLVILGVPALLLWRRYRRVRSAGGTRL
ncbi:MAG: DUF4349 domain-containing protein [Terracidiphilus sp.]